VWFDDLTITHHQNGVVTQATDYGVWGDVLREQKANSLEQYRYGYQGQFAEKDEETGWSSFELRMFDAIIGRWLIPQTPWFVSARIRNYLISKIWIKR
jgi:RHS repeat-associated protein